MPAPPPTLGALPKATDSRGGKKDKDPASLNSLGPCLSWAGASPGAATCSVEAGTGEDRRTAMSRGPGPLAGAWVGMSPEHHAPPIIPCWFRYRWSCDYKAVRGKNFLHFWRMPLSSAQVKTWDHCPEWLRDGRGGNGRHLSPERERKEERSKTISIRVPLSPSQALVHSLSCPHQLWALGHSRLWVTCWQMGGGPAGVRAAGGGRQTWGSALSPGWVLGLSPLGLCDLGQLLALSGPDLPCLQKKVVFSLDHTRSPLPAGIVCVVRLIARVVGRAWKIEPHPSWGSVTRTGLRARWIRFSNP